MSRRLFAWEAGRGGEAVILLHGFGGWHGVWAELAANLDGLVIAYDLPGHGRSLDFPGAGPPKLAAEAVLADMGKRRIGSTHVVGHSMGGAIAVLMALAQPDLVRSLTLLAPGGIGEEINGPLLRRFAGATTEQELAACLAEMAGPGFRIPDRIIAGLAAMRSLPGQTGKLEEIAAAITRNGRQGVIDSAYLRRLEMPVAVVWGTLDPVLPYGQTERLPERFTLETAKDAGHMLVDEVPALVRDVIRRMTVQPGNQPAA